MTETQTGFCWGCSIQATYFPVVGLAVADLVMAADWVGDLAAATAAGLGLDSAAAVVVASAAPAVVDLAAAD